MKNVFINVIPLITFLMGLGIGVTSVKTEDGNIFANQIEGCKLLKETTAINGTDAQQVEYLSRIDCDGVFQSVNDFGRVVIDDPDLKKKYLEILRKSEAHK